MATLYVTEFGGVAQGAPAGSFMQGVPQEPPKAEQVVAITAGSVASSAFNANTGLVRLMADAVCSVAVGTNPTASATNRRLAANVEYFIGVPAGQSYKIAAITNT